MYRIEDRASYIRTVQEYLGINQSGVYDARTRAAVSSAQRAGGLYESGIVDRVTFELILRLFKERSISGYTTILYRFPYKRADQGEDVIILNNLIARALRNLTPDYTPPRGDFYNLYTEDAVDFLQSAFGYAREPFVDKALFMRILDELEAIELEKQDFE